MRVASLQCGNGATGLCLAPNHEMLVHFPHINDVFGAVLDHWVLQNVMQLVELCGRLKGHNGAFEVVVA